MRFVMIFVMSGLLLGAKGQSGECPDGSRAVGAPPPKGYELICWKRGRWLHGRAIYWHKNGQKKEEGQFKDGNTHGKWTYWSRAGKRLGTNQWTNGSGAVTFWYDNGQKKEEGEFKDGMRHGKWTYWSQAGRRLGTNQWTNGSGTITFWYDNGQKKEEGEIRKNIMRRGKWTFWSPKGQVGSGKFRSGMPTGVSKIFLGETPITCKRKRSLRTCLYANGKRASESTWIEGAQLIGRKCWDAAGKEITCPD
jgi:antitoxin component YwqK of YwqJK toxin-antitoxin module